MNNTHENFIEKYGERYTNKINHLQKCILEGETGEGMFVVLPLEAGLGKSLQTDRCIGEYFKKLYNGRLINNVIDYRRFLIVKRFKDELYDCVDRINQYAGRTVAVGVTGDNWREYKEDLTKIVDAEVIVTTHERYFRLAMNPFGRSSFAKDRHTLIIDEALNWSCYSYSEQKYQDVLKVLPFDLHISLINVVAGLQSQINKLRAMKKGKSLKRCSPKISKKLLAKFKAEISAQSINDQKEKEIVNKFVETIEVLYTNQCLYNNGRISSFDRELVKWGLKNNIILDASGQIDKRYLYAEDIIVDQQTPIIEHINWKLYPVPYNTSMWGISRTENYFECIVQAIIEHKREGVKTLIVTQMKNEDKLLKQLKETGVIDIAVAHFGEIIGRNDWRDFTQVWIIANPLIPMEVYPLLWSMAANKEITRHSLEMIAEKGKKGKFAFKNKDFEEIRMGCIVGDIYQAIKRINRDNTREAEVFVINADEDVITALQEQLPGIRLGEHIELDIRYRQEKIRPRKKDKADDLVDYIMSLPVGSYAKSTFREAIGITDNNFARTLQNVKVKRLESGGLIEITSRTIIKR